MKVDVDIFQKLGDKLIKLVDKQSKVLDKSQTCFDKPSSPEKPLFRRRKMRLGQNSIILKNSENR